MPDLAFEAIGTRWQIDTAEPMSGAVESAVHARIDEFDRIWSRFRSDSLVSTMSPAQGRYDLGHDGAELLNLYDRLYRLTDDAVTPFIGRSLEHLGYDAEYTLRPRPGALPAPKWTDAVDWDGRSIALRRDVLIDIGAAGKGYLVDLIGGVLREHGVDTFVIDAGGDILHRGEGSIRVALEHPNDVRKAIGVVELSNGAICASAANRRTWADSAHHVLDGTTGKPTRDIVASWAMADTARGDTLGVPRAPGRIDCTGAPLARRTRC